MAGEAAFADGSQSVEYVGPARDHVEQNPRDDADRELAAGHFEQALYFYSIAIERNPNDRHSLREAGRAAHALQKFDRAETLLTRAGDLGPRSDAELHYLLGEASWALGHKQSATQAHLLALREIGNSPASRIEKLWAARIYGRLGERAKADAIYDALGSDAEAALAQAEMHAVAKDWSAAERAVRRLLANEPKHARGNEMLAWVLEAKGEVSDELTVRKGLVTDDAGATTLRDYGRALERSGDWAGALRAYRKAATRPDGAGDLELTRALNRVDGRMSVELMAGAIGRSDPNSAGYAGFAGFAVPYGRASQWSMTALQEYVTSNGDNTYATELRGSFMWRAGDANLYAGTKLGLAHKTFVPGVTAGVSSGLLAGHLTLTVDAEAGTMWRETPLAVFEGGRVDSATSHVFVSLLDQKLIIDSGIQPRRLTLSATEMGTPDARQLLGWAGADYVAWTNFAHEARGQMLDDDLLHPTFAADSAVVSYRHYELIGETDEMFASRLSLANRASIDEVSVTLRKVLFNGALALDARGGFGRDWVRELYLGRGGVAMWLSPTTRSRLSLSFELARESVHAFTGERRTGWMNYHVDL
jgi:Flp pilus assembly protein TadD